MSRNLLFLLGFIATMLLGFLLFGAASPNVVLQSEVKIAKSIDDVWAAYIDENNLAKWLPGFVSIELLDGSPNAVGSEYVITYDNGDSEAQARQIITLFVPAQYYGYELATDATTSKTSVYFKSDSGNTTVATITEVAGNNWWYNALLQFSDKDMAAQDQTGYDAFKSFVEAAGE